MSVGIEALFTTALGLQAPWVVKSVELNTAKRRIDFEVACEAKKLACPACGQASQGIHDRVRKDWRHLDFFQFEAWLHADPEAVAHVCMDMSAAYRKGVAESLPKAAISYDRFHVIALAMEAMDEVRREEVRTQKRQVREAIGENKKVLKSLACVSRNPIIPRCGK